MKTIIILCLVFWMSTTQAQKRIALDPATVEYVEYSAPVVLVTSHGNNLNFEVREEYFNHFFDNPIKFVEENFDFHSLILDDFEVAEVRFKSSGGYLKAFYGKNGELMGTVQKFKNIPLPAYIRNKVYKENLGWVIVNNKYTASGKANRVDKELYRIKLSDGKKMRKIKISPAEISERRMVSNIKK